MQTSIMSFDLFSSDKIKTTKTDISSIIEKQNHIVLSSIEKDCLLVKLTGCRYYQFTLSIIIHHQRLKIAITERIQMNDPSYSSESGHTVTCCSSSSTPPMPMLTVNDYLDGLHCVHEAQKVNATPEEIIFKLRLYLEDKVGGKHILNAILTLIRTQQITDFNNHKEFEYCTSILPLFMVLICLENSLAERR